MADIDTTAVEEEATSETEEKQSGVISVEISDSNVRYDTNLAVPELLFWLRIVEEMVVQKVMKKGEE